jgi:hypothetical protein
MPRWTTAAIAACAMGSLASLPSVSAAQTTATSVTLSGGALQFGVAPQADPFAAATLTGTVQTLRTTFHDWTVTDARGSGAGWNVTMHASPMDDGNGRAWPAGLLVLRAPVTVLPSGVNAAVPPVVQGTSFTLDGAQSVKVISAAAGTGQGDWNAHQANLIGGDLVLTVPADALAGTYTTTITSTLATGP